MGRVTTREPEKPPLCFLVSCDVNSLLHTLLSPWGAPQHTRRNGLNPMSCEPKWFFPPVSWFYQVMGSQELKATLVPEELGMTSGDTLTLLTHSTAVLVTLDPELWVFSLPCRFPTKHTYLEVVTPLYTAFLYHMGSVMQMTPACSSWITSYITPASLIHRQFINFQHATGLVYGTEAGSKAQRDVWSKPWRNAAWVQGSLWPSLFILFAHRQAL